MSEIENEFRGFATRREGWALGTRQIDLTWPTNPDALLDAPATRERFARNEYMPYWAQPWPASVLLAEHLLQHEPGKGRSAIELGCGVGLVSVAAAMAGWQVTASDYDPDAVQFAALNASRNGVALHAARLLDFVEQPPTEQFDAILASDLLYERRLAPPLVRWIQSGLSPTGCALISDPNRTAAEGFRALLPASGLCAEVHEASSTAPAGLLTRGRIWRVMRTGRPA